MSGARIARRMIVAGTGHRPPRLGGYLQSVENRLLKLATIWLAPRKQEIAYLISGMAQGWDQAIAEAVVQLGIPYKAYVPYPGQAEMWPKHAQSKYALLLERAQEVVFVSGPGYEAWKLIVRDKRMVDHATDMLALFDGVQKGGTWTTIEYAQTVGRPVHNLWEAYASMQ